MAKVLLINPCRQEVVYEKAIIKHSVPLYPPISLAYLAAPLLASGHDVKILDLEPYPARDMASTITEVFGSYHPDFVGITFVTPSFYEAARAAAVVKGLAKNIPIIIGGVHPTSLPRETLMEGKDFDIAVIGEGDYIFRDIVNGVDLSSLKGVAFKRDGEIIINERGPFIEDLDALPFPAWHLVDLREYCQKSPFNKRIPLGGFITSRGCVGRCTYCTRSVFGGKFRSHSSRRVVDEIEYMVKVGFREIHILDDCFSADMARAKDILRRLIRNGNTTPLAFDTGLRVNLVDEEFFGLAKKAGVYQILYGIESGNQRVLNNIKKGASKEQAVRAVVLASKAGLEVIGMFMVGLTGETEESLRDTIDFAKSLDLDFVKFGAMIPLPGTESYDNLAKDGYIKSRNWVDFNYNTNPKNLYDHPTLSWETIMKYRRKGYHEFYFRPSFIAKRVWRDIKKGRLLNTIKIAMRTKW